MTPEHPAPAEPDLVRCNVFYPAQLRFKAATLPVADHSRREPIVCRLLTRPPPPCVSDLVRVAARARQVDAACAMDRTKFIVSCIKHSQRLSLEDPPPPPGSSTEAVLAWCLPPAICAASDLRCAASSQLELKTPSHARLDSAPSSTPSSVLECLQTPGSVSSEMRLAASPAGVAVHRIHPGNPSPMPIGSLAIDQTRSADGDPGEAEAAWTAPVGATCALCGQGAGPLVCMEGCWVHDQCAIWAPNCYEDEVTGRMKNVKKEVKRGAKLVRCCELREFQG